MLFSDFKSRVLKAYPDRVPSDRTFEDAVAVYVQSELARLSGDMTRFKTYRGSYRNLRVSLTGYEYTGDFEDLKASVYTQVRGTSGGLDKLLVEACSKYVAYQARLEVDRDDKMAAALEKLYQLAKGRVVGHTYTSDLVSFNAAVRKLLPVDNSRKNFSEPSGMLDVLVETFLEEHATLTSKVDEFIRSCQEDLDGARAWYEQRLEEALFEIHTVIPEYAPVSFRMYDFTHVQDDGEASAPTADNLLPGSPVERVRVRWPVANTDGNIDWEESGLSVVPWSNREFITHKYDTRSEEPRISFAGDGRFVVYPKLVSGIPAWASGTAYSVGDFVEHDGVYYQAADSGTSNGASPPQDVGVVWNYIDQTRPVELWVWYRVTSMPTDGQDVLYTELLARAVALGIRHQALQRAGGRDREAAEALQEHRRLRRLAFIELRDRKENHDNLDPLCGLTNPTNTIKSVPAAVNSGSLDETQLTWDETQLTWA